MSNRDFGPIHPVEILLEEFLKPMGISQSGLAKDIGVSPHRIADIVHGRRTVTADTALCLARYFSMEAQFWMNLQSRYDLLCTEEKLAGRLNHKIRPYQSVEVDGEIVEKAKKPT